MGLAEAIKAHRGRLRWSQIELGDHVGVRQATISDWESGKAVPSAANLSALADAFGVAVAELEATADGVPFPFAAPPEIHERILNFERDAARMGATNHELNHIAHVLRTPGGSRFYREVCTWRT